ncbi:MAG: hypothetical protein JKY14_03040 [Paraglaciecola sp.]|nr:hypothetical protein [Paraglaciecola sp.]
MQSLFGIVLLIGSGLCLKLCVASIIAARPLMAIVDLERSASTNDIKELVMHFNRIQTAIELFPSNAHFYTLAGRFHLLLSQREPSKYAFIRQVDFLNRPLN